MAIDPVELQTHYTAFLRPGRILLTGHSHQAWPDVARQAMLEAFGDAARWVDDKWSRVRGRQAVVQQAVAHAIGAAPDEIARGANTHELVCRFLSALDWRTRRHLVTTSGEFHSMRRQLERLAEAGVEVTVVPADPVPTLSARLAGAVRSDTAALLTSTVLFRTAAVVPKLAVAVAAARAVGAEVLLDAYHGFMAMPFDLEDLGAREAFVVAGGYKYAQWGEGCCWMRVPAGCALRPVYTGWFAEFAELDGGPGGDRVGYAPDGATRFAGSTFEPTSDYRAAAVAEFFAAQGLTPVALRAISLHQTGRIIDRLEGRVEILTPRDPEARGGFIALRVPGAADVVQALRARNIYTDSRGDVLRLGPAPYLDDDAIDAALDHLVARL